MPCRPSVEHDLNADELERDVRHRREDAGDGDGEGERGAVEATADEIGGGDVAVFVRHAPKARHEDEDERVRDGGVRHREEAESALSEDERRHGDERVRRVEIAPSKKPGDDRSEAPAAEPPFVKRVEVGAAPARRDESQHGHDDKRTTKTASATPLTPVIGHRPALAK